MKKLGLVIIMAAFMSILIGCDKSEDDFQTTVLSVTSDNYDYYDFENVDFVFFDDANALVSFFENDKFVLSENFGNEIEELEINNFFDTKSIICMISAIGTGDQISRKKVISDNKLTILYEIKRGEEEAFYIHFDFIEIEKSYIENFSIVNYEIKIV